jgi:putrescine transport system permease protein
MQMLIYSRIRLGLRPDINALATIIILVVAIGVVLAAWIMFRQQKRRELEMQMSDGES